MCDTPDLKWYPDHNEDGEWILRIFRWKEGTYTFLREYKSDDLKALHEHAKEVCDEKEIFFRLIPDDEKLREKLRRRRVPA